MDEIKNWGNLASNYYNLKVRKENQSKYAPTYIPEINSGL